MCKTLTSIVVFLFTAHLYGQTKTGAEITKLSKDFFKWEIDGKMDSLNYLIDPDFIVVGSNGKVRSKNEYLTDLKNGKPVHNKIETEDMLAKIHSNAAIITGKGFFTITVNDQKSTAHLSFMEVFVFKDNKWKMVALYASRLQD